VLLRRGIISSGVLVSGITDPNDIAGLQLWMDGETGLTTDKSDNSYTVNNTSVTISSADLNSLDTFRYNGSAFQSIGTQLGKPANYTISAVVKWDDAAVRECAFGSFNSGGSTDESWGTCIASQSSKPSKSIYSTLGDSTNLADSYTALDTLTNATYHIITLRYTSGDSKVDIWVDGVSKSTTDSGTATSCSGTYYEFALGRAGAVAGAIELTGNIAELALYDASLSAGQISNLEDYYTTRYAL